MKRISQEEAAKLHETLQVSLDRLDQEHRAAKQASKRTICKRFYVNAAEEAQIEQMRQGVSESRFFRSKVLGKSIPRPRTTIPQVNLDSYQAIANLRSNINQMAKAINTAARSGQTLPLTPAFLDQLAKLQLRLEEMQVQLVQANDATRVEEETDDRQD